MDKKNEIWEGRYFVDLLEEEAYGYKDVHFILFQDMERQEIERLLKPFGLAKKDEECRQTCYSYVEDTFDLNQVADLVKYFCDRPGPKLTIRPAYIPEENCTGYSFNPCYEGGSHKYYTAEGNPFNFKLCGFFDLRGCEETYETKLRNKVERVLSQVQKDLEGDQAAFNLLMEKLPGRMEEIPADEYYFGF